MKQIFKSAKIQLIIPILSMIILNACGTRPGNKGNALKQGISGQVLWVAGNRMPSPDNPSDTPPGIQCTLFIHELTAPAMAEAAANPSFYKKINSPLVKSFKTEKDGTFSIELPAGDYSVLMGVDSLFYANISDQFGNLNPVHVGKDSVTPLRLMLDYKAVY